MVCSVFLLNACTEEIDLYAPSRKIPVVYCLLDPDYSTQYIRVGQTFYYQGEDSVLNEPKLTWLDEDFDLYITYNDLDGNLNQIWFNPCSGVSRDSGLFPREELQVLTADMPVLLNTNYKLYLHLKESDIIVFGEVKSFEHQLDVIDPLPVDFRSINLYPTEDFYFRYRPVAPQAVYQAVMNFKYIEFKEDQSATKSVDFIVDMVFSELSDIEYVDQRFSGEFFLREIGRRLVSEPGLVRIPLGLDFHFWAGGEELFYLIKSANAQFGFSAQSTSNLDNAVGVFSSMSQHDVFDIPLSVHTADSLAFSQYTKHLGFLPYTIPMK